MNNSRKIHEFFRKIGNPTPLIASSATKNGMRATNINGAIELNNSSNHDVYFVVNPTNGFKKEDVKQLSTNFVDLDCGRDKNGKYKQLKIVNSFKAKALKRIKEFSVKPTAIVETRNGFHVYYSYAPVSANAKNRADWEKKQNALFNFFKDYGCDAKVLKPNQLMRVPHTVWHKKWSGNNKPFNVSVKSVGNSVKFENLPMDNYKGSNKEGVGSFKKWATIRSALEPAENDRPWASQPESRNAAKTINSIDNLDELAALLGDVVSILYAKQCKFLANAVKAWQQKLIYG